MFTAIFFIGLALVISSYLRKLVKIKSCMTHLIWMHGDRKTFRVYQTSYKYYQ